MISRPRVLRGRDPGCLLLVQKLDRCLVHPRHLERFLERRKEEQRGGGREGRKEEDIYGRRRGHMCCFLCRILSYLEAAASDSKLQSHFWVNYP